MGKTSSYDALIWARELASQGFDTFFWGDLPSHLRHKNLHCKAVFENYVQKTGKGRVYASGNLCKLHTGAAAQYRVNPEALKLNNIRQKIKGA